MPVNYRVESERNSLLCCDQVSHLSFYNLLVKSWAYIFKVQENRANEASQVINAAYRRKEITFVNIAKGSINKSSAYFKGIVVSL